MLNWKNSLHKHMDWDTTWDRSRDIQMWALTTTTAIKENMCHAAYCNSPTLNITILCLKIQQTIDIYTHIYSYICIITYITIYIYKDIHIIPILTLLITNLYYTYYCCNPTIIQWIDPKTTPAAPASGSWTPSGRARRWDDSKLAAGCRRRPRQLGKWGNRPPHLGKHWNG